MIDLYDPVTACAAGCCVAFCFCITASIATAAYMATGRDTIEVRIDVARALKRAAIATLVTGILALLFVVVALIIHFRSGDHMAEQELQAQRVDCGCGDVRVELELKQDGTAVAIAGCPHREQQPVFAKEPFVLRIATGEHVFIVQTVCPTKMMERWGDRNATA